jgi:hypothetical protein
VGIERLIMTDNTKLIHDGNANFLIRIVYFGDNYGHDMCLMHNQTMPLIEFYDHLYAIDFDGDHKLGQFISRYSLGKLLENHSPPVQCGLDLDGSVQKWKISADAMAEIMEFVQDHIAEQVSHNIPNPNAIERSEP